MRKIKGLFLGAMIICLSLIVSLGMTGMEIYTSDYTMWSSYIHKDKKLLEDNFYRSNYFEFSTLRPILHWLVESAINEDDKLEQDKYIEQYSYTTWDEEKQKDVQIVPTKEEAIKSLKSMRETAAKNINEIKNMNFIVVNTDNNNVYTNTKYKTIDEYENSINDYVDIQVTKLEDSLKYIKDVDNKKSIDDTEVYYNLLGDTLIDNLEIRLSFPPVPKGSDYIFKDYSNYNKMVQGINIALYLIVISFTVFMISFIIYKLIRMGKEEESKFIYLLKKIYLEIWIGMLCISGVSIFICGRSYTIEYFDNGSVMERIGRFDISILIYRTIFTLIFISTLYLLLKILKLYENKIDILKNTLIYNIFKIAKYLNLKVFTSVKNKISDVLSLSRDIPLFKRVLILSIIWISIVAVITTLIYILFLSWIVFPFAIIASGAGILFLFIKEVSYLDEIIRGTEKIKDGELNYKIEVKGNDYLTILAENINNIGQGLENSIDKQLRSERMKSELITNVSHDLKTPLTSIINYIELIKKEENIQPEHVKDYVNVLESKSKRLKSLIEDLFEASKASSGNIQLNMEKIEISQLLRQAIGEMEEKLNENNLDIKLRLPEDKVYITADGRRLYRVLENLLSNIYKYSLNNTRVYIDIIKDDSKVRLVMKNISSYELNFDPDEIMERFKRADESRNTEGSGLGLAIARDLVKIQGGKFDIEIDGDLFKSIVEFEVIN